MGNTVRAIALLALGVIEADRHCTLEPSCFGTPLSALARLPCPIRELRGPEDLLPETHSSREFMKLMGWLTTYDVETVVCSFPALTTCVKWNQSAADRDSLSGRFIHRTRRRKFSSADTRGQLAVATAPV